MTRFIAAFYAVADNFDPATSLQRFLTRQSLLRAWGESQGTRLLIDAPISTGIPFLYRFVTIQAESG